jgi:membrane fusion protein, heavy metal efflux system
MSLKTGMNRGSVIQRPAGAVLLVATAILVAGCGNNTESVSQATAKPSAAASGKLVLTPEELARMPMETVAVARGALRVVRDFPATIRANENEMAQVTALIRGRVDKVQVDVGTDVGKGALLAVLHSTDLGLAEAAYLKAAARLHEADLAYRRAKELHEAKAVSLAELQRREAEMRTIRAEARESQNRLELLGVTPHELERLARENTIKADVAIRAPFSGRVIMRDITRGEVVDTQQTLFTVADLSEVWVVANVPEKDVEFIRKDQEVEVIAAAYPHAFFRGAVTYIGDVLDSATRTLRVRVTVPNPEKRLKPEMFALVHVHAAVDPEVLTVPLAAIQNGPSGKVVFIQRAGGEFEIRSVRVGDEHGDAVIVLDGLRAGETVLTKGSFVLKSEMDRQKLEPTP